MSDLPETYSAIENHLAAYLETLKVMKTLHYRLVAFDMEGNCRHTMCGHCKVEWPCMTMELLAGILDDHQ